MRNPEGSLGHWHWPWGSAHDATPSTILGRIPQQQPIAHGLIQHNKERLHGYLGDRPPAEFEATVKPTVPMPSGSDPSNE